MMRKSLVMISALILVLAFSAFLYINLNSDSQKAETPRLIYGFSYRANVSIYNVENISMYELLDAIVEKNWSLHIVYNDTFGYIYVCIPAFEYEKNIDGGFVKVIYYNVTVWVVIPNNGLHYKFSIPEPGNYSFLFAVR